MDIDHPWKKMKPLSIDDFSGGDLCLSAWWTCRQHGRNLAVGERNVESGNSFRCDDTGVTDQRFIGCCHFRPSSVSAFATPSRLVSFMLA